MDYQELLESLDDYGDGHTIPHAAAQRIRQLESILSNLKGYVLSNLKNDRAAYFFHLIEWGQGLSEKPIPENMSRTKKVSISSEENMDLNRYNELRNTRGRLTNTEISELITLNKEFNELHPPIKMGSPEYNSIVGDLSFRQLHAKAETLGLDPVVALATTDEGLATEVARRLIATGQG